MAQYTAMVASTLKLIKKMGRPVDVVRPGTGTAADTSKPWKLDTDTSAVNVALAIPIVFVTMEEARGSLLAPEELSPKTTAVAIAAAASFLSGAPEDGDRVVDGSDRYNLVALGKIKPGPVDIVYILQLQAT